MLQKPANFSHCITHVIQFTYRRLPLRPSCHWFLPGVNQASARIASSVGTKSLVLWTKAPLQDITLHEIRLCLSCFVSPWSHQLPFSGQWFSLTAYLAFSNCSLVTFFFVCILEVEINWPRFCSYAANQDKNVSTGRVLGQGKSYFIFWVQYGNNFSPVQTVGSWWCWDRITTHFQADPWGMTPSWALFRKTSHIVYWLEGMYWLTLATVEEPGLSALAASHKDLLDIIKSSLQLPQLLSPSTQ